MYTDSTQTMSSTYHKSHVNQLRDTRVFNWAPQQFYFNYRTIKSDPNCELRGFFSGIIQHNEWGGDATIGRGDLDAAYSRDMRSRALIDPRDPFSANASGVQDGRIKRQCLQPWTITKALERAMIRY